MPRFDRLELEPSASPISPPQANGNDLARDEHHWLRMADAERRQGNYENALRFYSRSLESDKSLVAGWLGQIQMLVFLGEYPEADLWASKALELFKNQPDLLAARAQAVCRKGDFSQARSICDLAFAQPGQSAYRWSVRGELMAATRQDMDRYCFDKAVQVDSDWLVPLEAGAIFRYYRQPSKALVYTRKAIAQQPENAHLWFQQARCETELNLYDSACRSLRRCLELEPHHTEAATMLANLDVKGGRLARIFRWFFSSK